jgi:Fe-S cluster biogenesis protein NfuA
VSDPSGADEQALAQLTALLDRLEDLLTDVEGYDEPVREQVFELLDGIDALHRLGILRLADALDGQVDRLSEDPAVRWLFQAYGVGIDDIDAAQRALEPMKPYLHEHGGDVEVLGVANGVVRVRLAGACSGCTASAITLREGVEEALRDGLPGFQGLDVEPDTGPAHPPPGPTLLQIQPRPA